MARSMVCHAALGRVFLEVQLHLARFEYAVDITCCKVYLIPDVGIVDAEQMGLFVTQCKRAGSRCTYYGAVVLYNRLA